MSLRAVQQEQVKRLYRHSLKNMLSWAIRRDIFYQEVRPEREHALSIMSSCDKQTKLSP